MTVFGLADCLGEYTNDVQRSLSIHDAHDTIETVKDTLAEEDAARRG